MIQAFIRSQRAAATAVAFILTYFVALTLGRFFQRRAQVPLGLFFQTFCLTLAFYAAITVYGVQADWRKHVGAALALLSPAFIIALANHFLWDFYFEKKRQTPIPHILREIFALLVFLITLLLVLSFGYHAEAQLKGLLAGSGIVAIIVGFAGQNLFGGIIAGIQLQISRPFRVGDWLQVGERFAEVMEINWRSTRLRTNDGIYLDIPNNEIVRETIVNLHYPTQVHAMRIRVGIDYKTPPNRVKDALMRATRNAELVLRDPPPRIFLVDFADHAVIVEGAEGDSMFVLLRGSANVSVAKNGAPIHVGTLHSGDCFGEMSLLTGERRTATVRAAADCYILEISKPVMGEVIRQSPESLNQLSELLAKRKMETEGIIKDAHLAQNEAAKQREYSATFLQRLRTFFEV